MEAYKKWVRRNKDYVHSLESLANGMTWLLPERFSESEIGPEAVTAILGIVTAINEHIIESTPSANQQPSSFPYSLCISALKDLETLVEVVAQHYYGEDSKWNFIAVTEGVKVLVRLALFRDSGYKFILQGGETPNVSPLSNSQHGVGRQHPWKLEGNAISALSKFGEDARMSSDPTWLHRIQHQQSIIPPPGKDVSTAERPTLSTFLSGKGIYGKLFVTGEVLFITRPLIYVLFIRKYGIRSWVPWFLSLAVDLTGMGILSLVTKSRWYSGNDQKFHLSDSEKDEVRRRKLLCALYLMRDPFFSKYTRQRLEKADKVVEPVPIFGLLTGKIVELIIGAQSRYTYMSGS